MFEDACHVRSRKYSHCLPPPCSMYVWIYLVISLDLKTAAKLQFLVPLYSVQVAGCSQAEKLCNGKKVGRSCMNLHTHTTPTTHLDLHSRTYGLY